MLDQKIKLIRERMVKEGISMLVLSPGPHMAWLFDFYPLPDERPCFSCLSLNVCTLGGLPQASLTWNSSSTALGQPISNSCSDAAVGHEVKP